MPENTHAKISKTFLSGKLRDGAEVGWIKIATKKFETL
jgi:hypothetical protein